MRRRRFLSAFAMVAVIAAVALLDMKILTHPSLLRNRAESVLVSVFRYPVSFHHPVADLHGTLRLQDFRLAPPHHGYSLTAREIEMRLDLASFVLREGPIRRVKFRQMTLRWDRGHDDPWDLAPFLRFCERLRSSPAAVTRIEGLKVVIGMGRTGGPWTLDFDWIDLRPHEKGILMKGWSTQPPWSRLQFEILADTKRADFTGWIRLNNLRIRPQDVPWLPEPATRILSSARPRGTGDVRIALLGGGQVEVRIQPVNLSLRPESFPYPLRKITQGTIVADSSGIRLDGLVRRSGKPRFRGSATFPLPGGDGDDRLDLAWEEVEMDETLEAALPEDLGWVWKRARPRGTISGQLRLAPSSGRFGAVQGEVDLDPMHLLLPIPIRIRGRASVSEEASALVAALRGAEVELAGRSGDDPEGTGGIPLGRLEGGDLIVADSLYRLRGLSGGSRAGSFRARYRQSRMWPSPWSGSLTLSRSDLGETLALLTGGTGARGGQWNLWLHGSGREGARKGRGAAWLHAPEGREMPLLGKIFPPGPGRSPEVRGALSLDVRQDSVRITRIDLVSGRERALGTGVIRSGGRFRLELRRRTAPGPVGPSGIDAPRLDSTRSPPERGRAARIVIEGTAGSLRFSVHPVSPSTGGGS